MSRQFIEWGVHGLRKHVRGVPNSKGSGLEFTGKELQKYNTDLKSEKSRDGRKNISS